jgi:OmpA-OmpF porin, OOP family
MKSKEINYLIGLYLLFPILLNGQNMENKWAFGFHLGISEYQGDLGNGFFQFHVKPTSFYDLDHTLIQKNRPGIVQVSVTNQLNPLNQLSLVFSHGEWGYFKQNTFFFKGINSIEAQWKHFLIPEVEFPIQPYLVSGIGYRNFHVSPNKNSFHHEIVVPLGIGLNLHFSQFWYLNFQSNIGFTTGDIGDGIVDVTKSPFDKYWNHSLGIVIIPHYNHFSFFSSAHKYRCPRF